MRPPPSTFFGRPVHLFLPIYIYIYVPFSLAEVVPDLISTVGPVVLWSSAKIKTGFPGRNGVTSAATTTTMVQATAHASSSGRQNYPERLRPTGGHCRDNVAPQPHTVSCEPNFSWAGRR